MVNLAQETPVAMVVNGTTLAVLMATPADLEDFAKGFALSEGISGVESCDIIEHDSGIEARLWVSAESAQTIKERQRTMLGPIGCGLCGVESIEAATRSLPNLTSQTQISAPQLRSLNGLMRANQPLQDETRSAHAAGFFDPQKGLIAVREDVGRHNALDKLIGHMGQGEQGAVVMTSRLSVDLVQKTALFGASILIGFSAPTQLAVKTAQECNMTLIGFCNDAGFEVFAGRERVRD